MNETEIRERLMDLAADAPERVAVPPQLVHRARRRVATTVGATLMVVVALVFGSVVAVRSIRTSAPRPANPEPTPERVDRFANVHGWIAYSDGSHIVAADPNHPENRIALGPANGAYPLEWSRDGSRLLLQGRGDKRTPSLDLYIMEADGSRKQLTHDGESSWGSISPDGATVAFNTNDGLYVVDVQGGAPRLLAAGGDAWWPQTPTWSPDGSRIAYVVYREGPSLFSIWVMNPDGTGRRKLVDLGHRSTGGLAWSPDGSTLAFGASTPDGSSNQIYVMDADGSRLRTLTEPDLNATGNWWSPDGSRIAFFTGGYLALHLTTMASDGSDMRVVDGFPALPEVVVGEGIAWNPVG